MNEATSAADFDYDVAVSFAGEDRDYVESVVRSLKELDITVFYDEDEVAALWGENLVDALQAIYTKRARYAILFVSQAYATKKWTSHERATIRATIQDRALQQATSPYVLPIRLDDTELPGMPSTVSYLDAREHDVAAIVDAVSYKLGQVRTSKSKDRDWRVPANAREISLLLEERPPAWEYLLYVAILKRGTRELDSKYRDHTIGYARQTGLALTDKEGLRLIRTYTARMGGIISSFNRILQSDVQVSAFGLPGESGDSDRIVHIAERFCSLQEEFLDASAELRSTSVGNEHLRTAKEVLARFADQPLASMRAFVADLSQDADTWSARLRAGEEVMVDKTIELEVPADLSEDFSRILSVLEGSCE